MKKTSALGYQKGKEKTHYGFQPVKHAYILHKFYPFRLVLCGHINYKWNNRLTSGTYGMSLFICFLKSKQCTEMLELCSSRTPQKIPIKSHNKRSSKNTFGRNYTQLPLSKQSINQLGKIRYLLNNLCVLLHYVNGHTTLFKVT